MSAVTGDYWIQIDGTQKLMRCDMDFDGGGWLMIVGADTPNSQCSWFSSYHSCSKTRVAVSGEGHHYLRMNIPSDYPYNKMRYKGSVFTSGGTHHGVMDLPDSGSRQASGGHPNNGCGCSPDGCTDTTTSLSGTTGETSWMVWSDGGNACGSSGAHVRIDQLWIKMG